MNLLPEVLDCVGYSHNHSPLISSNRNSPFERLWRVSHQTDYTIRELLITRPNCRAVELSESNLRFQFHKRSQLFVGTHNETLSVTVCVASFPMCCHSVALL